MMVLYISGPFSSDDRVHGVQENILRASRIAFYCWERGWAVICPHKNCAGFEHAQNIPADTWIEGDIAILERCDAVLMLPRWKWSPGAVREHNAAKQAGIPVFYYEQDDIPSPEAIV